MQGENTETAQETWDNNCEGKMAVEVNIITESQNDLAWKGPQGSSGSNPSAAGRATNIIKQSRRKQTEDRD